MVKLRKQQIGWSIMALVVIAIAVFAVTPYLHFDPALSRVKLNPSFVLHFPLLLVHIFAAVLALLLGPLQFLSRIRTTYPLVHRITGRTYLGCVLVGGVTALVIGIYTADYTRQLGFLTLAVLWLVTAWKAYRAIRQRRVQDHRRWMVRNYALTLVAITARALVPLGILILFLRGEITSGPNVAQLVAEVLGTGIWLGLVLNIVLAEWLIVRRLRPLAETKGQRPIHTEPNTGSVMAVQTQNAERAEKVSGKQ